MPTFTNNMGDRMKHLASGCRPDLAGFRAERRQWSAVRPAGHDTEREAPNFVRARWPEILPLRGVFLWPAGRTALHTVALALASVLLAGAAGAKEIHSNGLGGGRWSDTTTWRGGAVPGEEDDAVI